MRDREASSSNSGFLAAIHGGLLKLDKGTKSSEFIGKWVHLNYYINC